MTSIKELVFYVTMVGNKTVVVKLYDDYKLCKACSCTLSCRKFIFQSPHNINLFHFECTFIISVSNLSICIHHCVEIYKYSLLYI
jgi:hypothetical protein